jgi:hypothetical protein
VVISRLIERHASTVREPHGGYAGDILIDQMRALADEVIEQCALVADAGDPELVQRSYRRTFAEAGRRVRKLRNTSR